MHTYIHACIYNSITCIHNHKEPYLKYFLSAMIINECCLSLNYCYIIITYFNAIRSFQEFGRAGPTSFLVIGLILCFISVIAYMTLWLVGLTLLKPDSKFKEEKYAFEYCDESKFPQMKIKFFKIKSVLIFSKITKYKYWR